MQIILTMCIVIRRLTITKEVKMKTIKIYDPSMCCSSGVCGTDLNQNLVTFSADFSYLRDNKAEIQRFNLAQEPMAFVESEAVAAFLEVVGEEGLPITLIGGHVALTHRYPTREELVKWADISIQEPKATKTTSCCASTGCC